MNWWPKGKKEQTQQFDIMERDLEDFNNCIKHLRSFNERCLNIYDFKNHFSSIYGDKIFRLPSNRIGNILGMTLELRQWFMASLLIECDNIDIESVSYLNDGSDAISAEQYIISLKECYHIYGDTEPYDRLLEKIAARKEKSITKIKQ